MSLFFTLQVIIFLSCSILCEVSRSASLGIESTKCKSCSQRKAELPEEDLRKLRLEYLKQQILKKLHLSEPPKTNLSKPFKKPLLLIAEAAENNTFKADWLSSEMESMIIYPRPENISCGKNDMFPCIRFDFLLSGNVDLETFTSAEIWLFKTDIDKSIRVYEAVTEASVKDLNTNFSLLNKDKSRSEDHWIKFKIPVSSFRDNFGKNRILSIQVTYGENVTSKESPVLQTGSEKPFVIIRGYNKEVSYRNKRSTSSCVDGSTCCRENFYLNFAEIGWDNWILHPEGYDANFCRGRCFNDLSNTRFYHSAVLLSYIRDNKDIAEEIGLNMCCTPSAMSPISIIYQNEEGIFYHKSIENMKVESCDCA